MDNDYSNIVNYLIAHDHFKYSADRTKIQRGVCPACKKKEAWAKVERPHYIYCNRSNKCGAVTKVKDLYPFLYETQNIIEQFEKEIPTNPNAIADAYLKKVRGFNGEKIKGWYSQHLYINPNANKKTYTTRFQISPDCFFERFVEPVIITDPETGESIQRKNRIIGNYQGLVWQPPTQTLEEDDKVYITEAVFKSIALVLSDVKSVSALSASHFPDQFIDKHKGKNILWVIALDNDKAGNKYTLSHIEKLKELGEHYSVVLPPKGKDWDDLYRENRLTDSDFETYYYYGDLLKAESREEKALAIYRYKHLDRFIFEFARRTYSCTISVEQYEKAINEETQLIIEKSGNEFYQLTDDEENMVRDRALANHKVIDEIANFTADFLYYEQPDVGDEGKYFFAIDMSNGSGVNRLSFSGAVFSSASDFKKAMQRKAPGALFTGASQQLDLLYRRWFAHSHKSVSVIDYVGYCKAQNAYVYNDIAIQNGKVIKKNADEFFELEKGGIKTQTMIAMSISSGHSVSWLNDYRTAYSVKGLVVLVWWLGSLFVNQIRETTKIYPFAEVYGEPSAGKTWMIEFLWKLFGRENEEGFDPSKSTLAGRTRKFTQVSNLPVVMIESDVDDNAHQRRFDWEELKPMSDGRLGRVTGQKDGSNTTKEPQFLGAAMIAQNNCINASKAVLSRLVQIHFDRSHHSYEGKIAADRLDSLPAEQLSSVLVNAVRQESSILREFFHLLKEKERLVKQSGKVEMIRIANTHGQIIAMSQALRKVIPFTNQDLSDIERYLCVLAEKRQQAMQDDHPIIQQFWSNVDYLDSARVENEYDRAQVNNEEWLPAGADGNKYGLRIHQMNHATQPDEDFWVSLPHYISTCRKRGLEFATEKDLRKYLPSSQKRRFVGAGTKRSRLEGKTMRLWQFKR